MSLQTPQVGFSTLAPGNGWLWHCWGLNQWSPNNMANLEDRIQHLCYSEISRHPAGTRSVCLIWPKNFVILSCRHEGPVWQVAWAHPTYGNILASCSYDRKVIIWKEENGTWDKMYKYTGHNSSGTLYWLDRFKMRFNVCCIPSDC